MVLGTGGTIAGTAATPGDNVGYTAAQVGVAELLADLAPFKGLALVTEQVAQLDSKDMSFDVWGRLAQRCSHWLAQDDVQGIVITHGTDTLEETAYFLHAVLPATKPVVLTCAMRPSTAIAPDGPQNLLDAVAVASCTALRGVVAVCAGAIHSAIHVQKVHPYRLDAFDSGDAGPLGYIEEGALRWVHGAPHTPKPPALDALTKLTDGAVWPRVEIVMNHAGASGAAVNALVKDGVHGLVVAATGNGSLHHDLEAALLQAQTAGVRIVRATRCAEGRVLPLAGAALADSQGLSPVKARVAMLLDLLR